MNKIALLVTAFAFTTTAAFAATGAKSYQVTGPVTAMDDKTVTVEKDKEKWQINRGDAAVPADVKVGSKVTVEYTMTATKVTDKTEKKK